MTAIHYIVDGINFGVRKDEAEAYAKAHNAKLKYKIFKL